MKTLVSILTVLILVAFSSCDKSRIFDSNKDFKNETWDKDSVLVFNININDTIGIYNLFINTRISGNYKYSNMYLFIDTELPDKKIIRDTLECILFDYNGKHLGKGFGSVWSNKIPYRIHTRFPYKGNYKFTIEQAMRTDNLENVVSAGLRIEKAK